MQYFLVEVGLVLGVMILLLLIYFRKKNTSSNFLLAITLFCSLYSLFVNNLNQTGLILEYPVFMRTANITAYLIYPFLYLYCRNTFYPGLYWRRRDWLFLLPALVYVIDMIPFFFSDSSTKIAVMKLNLADPSRMNQVSEGWISIKGFHFVFRYLWSLVVMILLIRLIMRNWDIASSKTDSANRTVFRFIIALTAIHIPLIFPGIIGVVFQLKWYSLQFINIDLSLVIITVTIFLLFSPQILYGFSPKPIILSQAAIGSSPRQELNFDAEAAITPARLFLESEELSLMIEKVERFIEEKKPFLDQNYTIHDMGRDLQIPVYQLSPIINQHFKSNFSSWINKYRVNYFISLSAHKEKRELTLEALARESGFANRTTFISAFKKEKNTTPGFFLRNLTISD